MEGRAVSHYKVLKKIGEGGMGEVYLAQDISLKRKVALKFLPEYLQSDEVAQKRFLREAQSAAALDHPYICHIHEVGEAEGRNFIAMEYVEGKTLQERLLEGRVPLRETLRIGTEIAEALEEAHQKGIVHRDLKPSNIMFTPKGHAKVMDFGLAKRLPEAGDVRDEITAALTREGTTLGTLAYMSPEQTRGKVANNRADIFSFGIVLFEMLTGVHPFRRETQAETSNAILNEHHSSIDRYTEDTSDLLQHTLDKMLAKDPNQRYQSVHEIWTNLSKLSEKLSVPGISPAPVAKRRIWVGAGAVLALVALVFAAVHFYWPSPVSVEEAPIDSIAILPFENESEDPDMEYLNTGVAEIIAFKLTPIRGLRVMSPDQLGRFRGQQVDAQKAAQELRVKSVLTGSLNVIGDTLALRVRLFDAEGSLIWGQPYSQPLTDIVAMQEEIAGMVAEKLQLQLNREERSLLARSPTENLEAYHTFKNGWQSYLQWTEPGLKQAIQYFEKALQMDPKFAMAYLGLFHSYWRLCDKNEEYCMNVRESAEKLYEMDETLPQAHIAMGQILCSERDWEAAGEEFNWIMELDPDYSHVGIHMYLVWMGRLEEAEEQVEQAFLSVDPLSATEQYIFSWHYWITREYDLALEKFQRARELDPEVVPPLDGWWGWLGYLGKGMEEEASSAFLSMREPLDSPEELEKIRQVFGESGLRGVLQFRLDDLVEEYRDNPIRVDGPYQVAGMYALVGESDLAFEWLEKYYESSRLWIFSFFPTDPRFDPLRNDPRFEELLRKLNLPEEAIQRHLSHPSN